MVVVVVVVAKAKTWMQIPGAWNLGRATKRRKAKITTDLKIIPFLPAAACSITPSLLSFIPSLSTVLSFFVVLIFSTSQIESTVVLKDEKSPRL